MGGRGLFMEEFAGLVVRFGRTLLVVPDLGNIFLYLYLIIAIYVV